MTALELWPGLLPLHHARWSRNSRLVADDGMLTLHRGRSRREFVLRDHRLHPIGPIRDLQVSCPLVAVDASGSAVCTVDLAEWVPAGTIKPGTKIGRPLGEPFDGLKALFGEALGAKVSSTPWNGERGPVLSPVDQRQLWRHRALLLSLAVIAVISFPFGLDVLLVPGGVAAVVLIAIGLSPIRNWTGRSAGWRMRSRHLGDEVGAISDGTVLRLKTSKALRAGCLSIGPGPHQVDCVDEHPQGLRFLLSGGIPVADLTSDGWGGESLMALRDRLASTPGVRIRTRRNSEPKPPLEALVNLADPPATKGGAVCLAVFAALGAWAASYVSVVGAAFYGLAAVVALGLALELVMAERSGKELVS